MDRSLNDEIPARQKWVYALAENSVGKILTWMILIFIVSIILTFVTVKAIVTYFK